VHNKETLQRFADATQSLKLYRRAELREEANYASLIEKLYVDPLPNEAILQTMLRPNTTLLVGRKGTGKSTVFQRAQHEFRKKGGVVSAYIDIKTVYESSEADPTAIEKLANSPIAASEDELKKLLLYRSFSKSVFSEIQKELTEQITKSWKERAKEVVSSKRKEVIESLKNLIDDSFDDNFLDVTKIANVDVKSAQSNEDKASNSISANIGVKSGLASVSSHTSFGNNSQSSRQSASSEDQHFSKVLIKTFSITSIMDKLIGILSKANIKHLYIFIDDFSELPEEAMIVFVETILAPLNNWSNETIKFKIAGYPGRIYLGKIDTTKIDEIYLDTFRLYGTTDVATMEEKAIDFTKRLLESRFQYYMNRSIEDFCESRDAEEIYRQFFFASSGNARNLGHILFNLRESHVTYGKPIGSRAIGEASRRYYEEKIEPYFGIQKFAHESFGERSSIFSLKELLESLVARSKDLRNYKGSTVTSQISGRTPSSHFHVLTDMDNLMISLELNFFLTKYYEMKDRDGRKVSVYALNHGLCNKYTIAFGRPSGMREFRLYYVERIFDYTPILTAYIERNQELKCESCRTVFGLDKLESIRLFDMMCPKCKIGECKVVNLSKKYEGAMKTIDREMLLPTTELGILNVLFSEKKDLFAADIAEELDCSFQLVGRRGKILAERGLVDRVKNNRNRRVFSITQEAKKNYFENNPDRKLDVAED